jgi:integrase
MRWPGPPKTTASARSISLPPFLITLLRQHLERHDNEFVFTNSCGNWLWHSDTTRRGLRPAADGNLDLACPRIRTYPIRPGLTFHGLRHSHKPGSSPAPYPKSPNADDSATTSTTESPRSTHTSTPEVEQRLLNALQQRWLSATKKCRTHPMPPAPTRRGNEAA